MSSYVKLKNYNRIEKYQSDWEISITCEKYQSNWENKNPKKWEFK